MKAQIFSCFILLFVALLTVFCPSGISRPIPLELLISDGVDEFKGNPSVIQMKGSIPMPIMHANDEKCEQMYGFLPCSTTVWGHLFLIVVYEYLLFNAESYLGSGGERIFKILGPGVYGACVFQIIGSLPEALILLASGLYSSEERAWEFVLTGVGLLAGSTILLLTLIWGTCILLSSQYFRKHLQSHSGDSKSHNPLERLLISQWPGYGVITDVDTSFTARIMLLSAIPLAIILIPTAFHLPLYGLQVFVIITLVVSILFLISHFLYQFFQPWIQRRRLHLYIEHEHLVKGITKWLDDMKDTMNKIYHSVQSLKDLDKGFHVLKAWVQKKREEREMMKHPDELDHLQSSVYGSLLTEYGLLDISAIKRRFKDVNLDRSNSISYSELKKLVTDIQVEILPGDAEIDASKMMEELDINGDQLITEEEFIIGLSKWLNLTCNQNPNSEKSEEENYQKTWEQTDKLIDDKFVDKSPIAWMKAIFLLALGIVMLGVLAEPLIHSVRDISKATNLPSFYVAFVLVPIATNARLAVSAITEARRKKPNTISLTLSEIYVTVFMNNILGLSVLLSLTYFRGMAWKFSAEASMVLFVSAIVGCLASFSTIFPVWTSLLAYLLYPLSLVIIYSLGDFDWFS